MTSQSAADQPGTSTSRPSSNTARPTHRHTTQKFKSYRDSDSGSEFEIDSEEERHLFGHPRNASGHPEASNAWIQKGKPKVHSPRSVDTESVASSTCSCEQTQNIWIRRPDFKGTKSSGACGNCSRSITVKGSDKNAVKKQMVKSRRDSTDSPISSPSSRRVFKTTSGREQKKDFDPSKRGVKVTSLWTWLRYGGGHLVRKNVKHWIKRLKNRLIFNVSLIFI